MTSKDLESCLYAVKENCLEIQRLTLQTPTEYNEETALVCTHNIIEEVDLCINFVKLQFGKQLVDFLNTRGVCEDCHLCTPFEDDRAKELNKYGMCLKYGMEVLALMSCPAFVEKMEINEEDNRSDEQTVTAAVHMIEGMPVEERLGLLEQRLESFRTTIFEIKDSHDPKKCPVLNDVYGVDTAMKILDKRTENKFIALDEKISDVLSMLSSLLKITEHQEKAIRILELKVDDQETSLNAVRKFFKNKFSKRRNFIMRLLGW